MVEGKGEIAQPQNASLSSEPNTARTPQVALINSTFTTLTMLSGRPGKRRRLAISSAVLWATNLFISPAIAIWPFPPKRFTGNALIDAGSMGLSGDGRVVALGDFDGNQLYMLFYSSRRVTKKI
jgi:hypothetical protein